jgi:DNA-binding CsgD family transcriptional regulator
VHGDRAGDALGADRYGWPVLGPVVVGRETELAEVDAFLDAAGEGFAALVLDGEAGIGKTTVWRQAVCLAEQRGVRVLACRASAAEAKLSFAGLADLLSSIAEEALGSLPAPQRDALAVALLRAAPSGRAPGARAVAAGFLSLLRALAATTMVLVAVDDWQWLDRSSRAVLEFAARRLGSEHVGLLCTLRSPAGGPVIGGAGAEERLRKVALGPLSLAALGRIIAARLGRSLPRPVLAGIARASAGNPFYALEVARLVIERGVEGLPGSGLPVPDDLRALTAARVRRLPAAAREALLLAAVLSAPDTDLIKPSALAPAEEAGIVTVDAAGRIEFAHPLFAAAVCGSVPIARRRALHRRAAGLVSDPEQRAWHLALGSDRADALIARQLDEAAVSAASRGAPDAAAELAELGAQLTPEADAAERGGRLLAAGRFHFDAGDLARAEALAQRALAGSPAGGLRTCALQLLAQLSARRSNFSEASELAVAALEAAGEDHWVRAGIELDLVYCAISLGDIAGAWPHARAAVADAQATGEDGILADALAVLTMAEFLSGRGVDRARLDRALALEDPTGASTFMMRPRFIQGLLALWCGELGSALEALGGVYEETVERGREGTAPMISWYLVWAHVWRGNLALAARLSEEALEAAALLEDPTTSGLALSASALVHAHDGRSELARAEAKDAIELFERVQWRSGMLFPLWALGLAELSEENPAAVNSLLGPLADQLAAMGGGDPVMANFLPDEIEALIALGDLERAQAHLERFESRARELDRAWAVAAAERCRGALAAARGEREAAFRAFERALACHQDTKMPFERARTQLVAGQTYRRFKQWGQARSALSEALATFELVGAPRWAQRTRNELARVGARPPAGLQLTETELRVAQLAASGLSNQDVADRAFISVKTVEANLTRVYRKLGVRSRAALADALHHSVAAEREFAR